MPSLIKFLRKNIFILVVILLSIPTFISMVKPGIYSMQDFHLFRLYEFNKCVTSFQIPCRWAPDAGLGYGEPLFNFYGQGAYMFGDLFHLAGVSLVDSTKLLFALSLIGSGIAMYFLAKVLWKNDFSAVLSSILYMYAPYRAVDVWVRGALPEALSFILFPLIIFSIEKRNLFYFSLLLFILTITHNLSLVMFLPLVFVWIIYNKWWKGFSGIVISLLLSSFYILPVLFESKYITLASTTIGYFDFRAHFITLRQIFLSNNWGYGGSTWGDSDNLNLSAGFLQWIIPAVTILFLAIRNKLKANKIFVILFLSGLFYLFLTHNKSTFIWETLPFMKYIQFPWRFFGVAVFAFSAAGGAIITLFTKAKVWIALGVTLIAILTTFTFFKEDIWYAVNDNYFTSGVEWDRQRTASVGDFWPNFGHIIPSDISDGNYINYFPGWVGATPDKDGLIPSVGTKFTDTPIRRIGNIISLISMAGFIAYSAKLWKKRT